MCSVGVEDRPSIHDMATGVSAVNKLNHRRVLLTTRSTCRGKIFLEFGTKFQKEVPLFLEIPAFPFNTVQNRWQEASTQIPSSICPVVSIQYQTVTDRQTDIHNDSIYRATQHRAEMMGHILQHSRVGLMSHVFYQFCSSLLVLSLCFSGCICMHVCVLKCIVLDADRQNLLHEADLQRSQHSQNKKYCSVLLPLWHNIIIIINNTNTHTHLFNGPLSGTTQVSRYQKGKTNLDFTEARDTEWQWHQLSHMQVCTSLQTDNHHSVFLQAGCPSCHQTNRVKARKAITTPTP